MTRIKTARERTSLPSQLAGIVSVAGPQSAYGVADPKHWRLFMSVLIRFAPPSLTAEQYKR